MAYDRLVRKTTKENLWLYLLSIIEQGPRYAYQLRDEIRRRFGFEVGEVTAYVVLYALKREGHVTISRTEPRKEGLARKYYQITPQGRVLLSKGISYFAELSEKLKREKAHADGHIKSL
jgi:DNA-binding PadR family transcriptional regulator